MTYITGTLLFPGPDYGKPVSAVDVQVNGQMLYISYLEGGKLKAGAMSIVQNPDGSLPIAMSGCAIV